MVKHPGDVMIKFTGPEDRIVRVNNRVNVHVNDRESALLNYLAQDPGYTVTQLSEMMNVSRKTIAGYLKALKEKGAIERIGTTRTGYWKIK
jgi:ATP-dependent DNA helicase RecG